MSIDYNRQRSLGIAQPPCSIVGCGGTGTWTGLFMGMLGSPKIKLFDGDQLELHNLNRLPYPPSMVGKPKNTSLQELIQKIRPQSSVFSFDRITQENISLLEGVIFDCTDQRVVQNMVQDYCSEKKLIYRRVGYDGNHITTLAQASVIDMDEDNPQDGYTVFPAWVVPSALIASLAVFSVINEGNLVSFMGNINTMFNMKEDISLPLPIERSNFDEMFG